MLDPGLPISVNRQSCAAYVWKRAVFTSYRSGDLTLDDIDVDLEDHPDMSGHLAFQNPEA